MPCGEELHFNHGFLMAFAHCSKQQQESHKGANEKAIVFNKWPNLIKALAVTLSNPKESIITKPLL
jgi:threonine/homoserine/homoserine lactone efflux protein